jgi:hypothetical protein
MCTFKNAAARRFRHASALGRHAHLHAGRSSWTIIDMGITHIIRGDDHLTNAARHADHVRLALGWERAGDRAHSADPRVPTAPNCPSAMAPSAPKPIVTIGYLPEALRNYLAAPGLERMATTRSCRPAQMIEWFDIDDVNKLARPASTLPSSRRSTAIISAMRMTPTCSNRSRRCCRISKAGLTYIDGNEGVLLHRGYPIGQLAEHSSFMEVAYLLLNGELPSQGRIRGLRIHDHPPHHAA